MGKTVYSVELPFGIVIGKADSYLDALELKMKVIRHENNHGWHWEDIDIKVEEEEE